MALPDGFTLDELGYPADAEVFVLDDFAFVEVSLNIVVGPYQVVAGCCFVPGNVAGCASE
jgi:hypothetical protein